MRLRRLVVAGLAIGVALGFLVALLRPRRREASFDVTAALGAAGVRRSMEANG